MMSFKSDHNFPAVGRRHVVVFISLLIKICGDEGNILLPRSLFKQLKLLIWGSVPIAWGPETPVSFLVPYLKEIDLVLIMSVKPGKGGQTFLESATSKIQFLNKMRQAGSYSYMIEVDGGINDVTKHQCAGADMLVAGSFITNYDNYQRQINKLR